MSDIRVSVAMCTYNGERFLGEQLQSIASQGLLPDEVVISDDCSTDGTASLLAAFSDAAPFPVRTIFNEQRLGPAKNFEKAISLCDGDVIVLSDQDDVWRPEKLKKLVEAFDRNRDAVYAFSDADWIDQDGKPLGQTVWETIGCKGNLSRFVGEDQLRILLRQNVVPGCSMAIRSSFRDIVLPIPDGWMHDYWIVLLGSTLCRGIRLSESLMMYRRHDGQVCGSREKSLGQAVRESIVTDEKAAVEKVAQFREVEKRINAVVRILRCPQGHFELLKQKEAHLSNRAALRSAQGLPRLVGVLAEAATGPYQSFSNSWFSIVRDLR